MFSRYEYRVQTYNVQTMAIFVSRTKNANRRGITLLRVIADCFEFARNDETKMRKPTGFSDQLEDVSDFCLHRRGMVNKHGRYGGSDVEDHCHKGEIKPFNLSRYVSVSARCHTAELTQLISVLQLALFS